MHRSEAGDPVPRKVLPVVTCYCRYAGYGHAGEPTLGLLPLHRTLRLVALRVPHEQRSGAISRRTSGVFSLLI